MAKLNAKPVAAPVATTPAPSQAEDASPQQPIEIPAAITVRELGRLLDISPIDLIKALMANGIMANINQTIDYDTAAIVAAELGIEVREERPPEPEPLSVLEEEAAPGAARPRRRFDEDASPDQLHPRPPVVTVMGHVDHGKTSLLDAIRQTNVVADEAGGITQHIGAYQVVKQDKPITFIDTPGHEAFTAMRARGAQVTDIAVLVVAADDGVMPQTLEALDHARAAGVPVVVALNKMDKDNANPDRVKRQLADIGLAPDDWGGDTFIVPVSAKKRLGIDDLLGAILLVAEEADLQANPDRLAAGTIIESEVDPRRGTIATVLIQTGTLHVGDVVVVGTMYGRVRAMFDDKGKRIKEADPSTPAVIMGLPDVPVAGQIFQVVENERTAREIVAEKAEAQRESVQKEAKVLTLDDVYAQMQAGKVKELNLILKVDVQGSLEPLVNSIQRLSSDDLKVKILRQGTGDISESDVSLAVASQAIVIGFNVDVDPAARTTAEAEGVDVRLYKVIYELVGDVEKALRGLLEPKYADVVVGTAEVKAVFPVRRLGQVAGLLVNTGKAYRNASARIRRDEKVVFDGKVASLRRFTQDEHEVAAGYECGLGVEGFHDFEIGDRIEFYRKERVG
jgi:translation initiation factor IF-2